MAEEQITPKFKQEGSKALEGFQSDFPIAYDAEGNQVQVDPAQLPELFKNKQVYLSGDAQVPVFNLQGERVYIEPLYLNAAIDRGYKLDIPDDQKSRFLEDKYSNPLESGQSVAEGLLRGVTAGLSDPLLAGLGVDADELAARKEVNAVKAGLAEGVGIVAPLLATGGGALATTTLGKIAAKTPIALASKGGKAIESVVGKALGKEATNIGGRTIQKLAPKVVGSAVEATLFETGKLASESTLGNIDLNAETILANLGTSALLGGGLGAGISGLEVASPYVTRAFKSAKDKVGVGTKKLVSGWFGVSEEALDNYIANPTMVEKAKLFEDFPMEYGDKIDDIFKRVQKSEINVEKATSELKALKKEAQKEFKDHVFKEEIKLDELGKVFESYKKEADSAALVNLRQLAKDIDSTVKNQREVVFAKSDDSLNYIEGINFKTSDITKTLDNLANEYDALALDEYKRAANQIRQYSKNFSDLGEEISGINLKKQIQAFNKPLEGAYGISSTSFDKVTTQALKDMRFELDTVLKDMSPSYREAMKDVAKETQFLKQLKNFDNEEKALRTLANWKSGTSGAVKETIERDILKALDDNYGSNFTTRLDDYLSRKEALNLSKPSLDIQNQEKIIETLKRNKDSILEDVISKSPELQAELAAQAELAESVAKKAGLLGITERNFMNVLKAAVDPRKANHTTALKQVKSLEQIIGDDTILEAAKLAKTKESFEKGFTHGSKNILLNTIVGSSLGGVPGGVAGAVFGLLVDKMGPKIAKVILDKYIKLAALEKMGIDVGKEIAGKASKFLGAPSLIEAGKKYSVPLYINFSDSEQVKQKEKPISKKVSRLTPSEFDKISTQITEVASNPSVAMDKISKNLEDFSNEAPNITNSVVSKSIMAQQYLYSKLPKDPLGDFNILKKKSSYKPSDYELSQFARYYEAVNNPISILDDLNKGQVTSEQVDVLKNVFPEMYQSTVSYMLENMAELQEDLSYTKKLQLSILFDVPVEAAARPDFILRMQSNMSPEQRQEVAQTEARMNLSGLAKMDTKKLESGSEQILNRA